MNLFIIILLFLHTILYGFGKNKVQYKTFEWQILKTPHFDIYYQAGEEEIAKFASILAEEANAKLSDFFNYSLIQVIPIIIYKSPNDFKQSNVILEIIPEGTAGFAEVFKNRVVLPFTGSYPKFKHVLFHELTHAFQFSILFGSFWEALFSRRFIQPPPLWVMEGLAEFISSDFDTETEMVLRDATINNQLMPLWEMESRLTIKGYKTYLFYKQSQAFFQFLKEKYTHAKISDFMRQFRRNKDISEILKNVFGKDMRELNAEWFKYLKRRYWGSYSKYKEPKEIASAQITKHFDDNSLYNLKPIFTKDDKHIIFFTDREFRTDIIMVSAKDGRKVRTIISGETHHDYEEMHSRKNSLSLSADGDWLVFISKSGPDDVINIYSLKKNSVIKRITPELDSLETPDISPDKSKIVFSGTKNGKSDIYVVDVETLEILRLTDDYYHDTQPVFSNDGKIIYFTSNRGKGIFSSDYDIFTLELASRKIEPLVDSEGKDISPAISPDSEKLAFISDRNGIFNLYIKNLITGEEKQITDVIGGIFDPNFSNDGKKIVFSSYFNLGQDIFILELDKISVVTQEKYKFPDTEVFSTTNINFNYEIVQHSFKVSPDWITGWAAFSTAVGLGGFLQMGWSDILGNHRFVLTTDFLMGGGFPERNFNFQLIYFYLGFRLNFGVSIFHFSRRYYYFDPNQFLYSYDYLFFIRRYGITTVFWYPFSKFLRAELVLLGMKYQSEYFNFDTNIFLSEVALVYDTTLWAYTGPFSGFRGMVSYSRSWNITGKDWQYDVFMIDLRPYLKLSRNSCFAFRFMGGSIFGADRDKHTFGLGGYNTVRGYELFQFRGRNIFLFNFEYRIPFIDYLQIAWPFPILFSNFRGVLFLDMGSVWNDWRAWRLAETEPRFKFQDLKCGFGFGLRIFISVFLIRLDLATPFDGRTIPALNKWKVFFSFGYDF